MRPGGSRTSERSFLFISKRQATGVAGMPIALLAAAAAGTGDDLICPGGKDGGGRQAGFQLGCQQVCQIRSPKTARRAFNVAIS